MKALYRHPIITSLIITPILLAIAAVSGGAGHGNYTLAIFLFPYAALGVIVLDHFFNATIVMLVLAILQFPGYGTLLSVGQRMRWGRIVVVGLLISHIVAISLALFVSNN